MARPRIGLIGWAPPPWGGVSVHVSRLARRLADDGFRVALIDLSRDSALIPGVEHTRVMHRPWAVEAAIAARRGRCDLLHMHSIGPDWRSAAVMVALQDALGVPAYLSVHSMRPDEGRLRFARQRLFVTACNRLANVIASGQAVAERLVGLGVLPHLVRAVVPHVRAPVPSGSLSADIEAFCGAHRPLVTGGANALRRWRGHDLYGFDLFVEAAARVLRRRPNAGFLFLLPRRGDAGLAEAALERAEVLGIGRSLRVISDVLPDASALWARGDVFVRPTRDDGDALSVREALDLGVPVLASDAVPRPDGVRLFPSGDAAVLATKLGAMLDDLPGERARVARLPREDDGADVLGPMYESTIARWRSLRTGGAAERSRRP